MRGSPRASVSTAAVPHSWCAGTVQMHSRKAATATAPKSPEAAAHEPALAARHCGPSIKVRRAPWRRGRPPCWRRQSCRWHPPGPAVGGRSRAACIRCDELQHGDRHLSNVSAIVSSIQDGIRGNEHAATCSSFVPAWFFSAPLQPPLQSPLAPAAAAPLVPHLLLALHVDLHLLQHLNRLVHSRLQGGGQAAAVSTTRQHRCSCETACKQGRWAGALNSGSTAHVPMCRLVCSLCMQPRSATAVQQPCGACATWHAHARQGSQQLSRKTTQPLQRCGPTAPAPRGRPWPAP